MPAPPHHQLLHSAHGTKVEVHDLFGNMPVRIKQRHSALTNRRELIQEWKSLQKSLVGLVLAWHIPVAAALKSSLVHTKLTLRPRMTVEYDQSKHHQRTPKSLDISWVCSLLSQAGYIKPSEWSTWTKTSARTPFMTIRGAFSLQPAETKTTQFISLGIRHLRVDSGASVLYDAVNHVFALSSFGNLEETVDYRAGSNDRRYKKDGQTNKQLRGAGKGVDHWPMFVIRIELQDDLSIHESSGQDILERESMLSSIIKVLEVMTTAFLSDHCFRPRARRKRRRPASEINAGDGVIRRESSSATRKPLETGMICASGSEIARPRSRVRHRDGGAAFGQDLSISTIRIPVVSARQDRDNDKGFRNWSRIKTGTARGVDCGFLTDCSQRNKAEDGHGPKVGLDRASSSSIHGGSDISIPPTFAQPPKQKTSALDKSNMEGGEYNSSLAIKELVPNQNTEYLFPWTNPITKDTVLINARTGLAFSSLQRPRTASNESNPPDDTIQPSVESRILSNRLARCTSAPTLPVSGSWVSTFLEAWENPVFAPAKEQCVPQVSFGDISLDYSCRTPEKVKGRSHFDLDNVFSDASSALSAKLSKISLAQAKIISQVDKKFILALIKPTDPNSSRKRGQSIATDDQQILVLIDQHAADERIRVESLLADLCTKPSPKMKNTMSVFAHKPAIATVLLLKPLIFQIKSQEQRLFTTQAQHFANWGILYDLSPQLGIGPQNPSSLKTIPQSHKISVKALPPVIAERCRLEPKLLIDLLRKEVWKREEEGFCSVIPSTTTTPRPAKHPHPYPTSDIDTSALPKCDDRSDADGNEDWLSRISACPQGILDMLNSRSCRSAIMFNDELSREECETLVGRLAKCRFPFQCAHGRPSVVPLVGLGSGEGKDQGEGIRGIGETRIFNGDGFGGKGEHGGEDFASAWKRWRREEESEGEGEGEGVT